MASADRRRFLKLAAAAGGLAAHPTIARALAMGPAGRTGTIADVEHVVILMQENRSFDHYFGSMRGVRGFDDPRPIALPGGRPVWFQPKPGGAGHVLPFRLNTRTTSAEHMQSLDHTWKVSHAKWKDHDNWIPAKGELTMGHFTREDLPFYYALADAFTVCDAYHCSLFGPTSPNRNFLFTGTNGLSAGYTGSLCVRNAYEEANETADPANDSSVFGGLNWTTYAERLEAAGISWKVYQEFDNYGDNSLAFFKQFRGANASPTLLAKGRGCVEGSNQANAKTSRGEHLIAALKRDVQAKTLPQVSWVVGSYIVSEHPSACPSTGEQLTAGLIDALTSDPEIWAKTVFILNYDENDGFFDHAPPPLPPAGIALGRATMPVADEVYSGEPVGLGPRVPMIIVSPWTRGGYVNSELFDHTSVVRFLEQRFGVHEPNISAWRRAVCGDLTSAFDFANHKAPAPSLPDTSAYLQRAAATSALVGVSAPATQSMPRQEPGQRPTRPLPYAFSVNGRVDANALRLEFANAGRSGVCFDVRAGVAGQGPWFYAVESGKQLDDALAAVDGVYDVSVYGPNGFLRSFAGRADGAARGLEADFKHDGMGERVLVVLRNTGGTALSATVRPIGYVAASAQTRELAPGASAEVSFDVAASARWYDLEAVTPAEPGWRRRFAGCAETGMPGLSDPAIGASKV
jgi:phospholipase C